MPAERSGPLTRFDMSPSRAAADGYAQFALTARNYNRHEYRHGARRSRSRQKPGVCGSSRLYVSCRTARVPIGSGVGWRNHRLKSNLRAPRRYRVATRREERVVRLFLGLLVLLASGQARTQECPSIAEYDEILAVVTQRFFDQTFNGLNWAERVRHYRDQIDCAADADRVASAINTLLEELGASHTALYTRQDMHYWGLNSLFAEDGAYETDFSGIWPEREGGRWFVKHVLEGSPAAKVGVRVGDELLAIAGEEFSPLGFGPGVSTLGLSSDGRIVRTVSLETRRQSVMRGFVDAARASERIISVGSKRIGYFHLWTARDAILESMEAALER